MKVLQLTTNYPCKENPVFGVFMKEQAESVEKYGVNNKIFFSNGLKAKNASIIHLKSAIKLFFHLLIHKYDVIHAHNTLSGLILLLSGGIFWNKTVFSIQNDPNFKGANASNLLKYIVPRVNKVIVKLPPQAANKKYIYLPNGVNLEFCRPIDKISAKKKLGLDCNKKHILFVDSNTSKGRTQKRKDRFDKTIQILKEKLGYDNIEELLLINVEREKVPLYMNAADLYLLTSDEEGSPNAVKECMACNTPVVATPVGNIPDLFDGVKECKISKGFDPEELAKLSHEVLIYNASINTRQAIINKNLDIDSIAKKLYNIYREVIIE